MFCTNCGKQLADGAKFCIYCGTPQNSAPEPDVTGTVSVAPEAPQVAPIEPVAPNQAPLDPMPGYDPAPEVNAYTPTPEVNPYNPTPEGYVPPEANIYADPVAPQMPAPRKKSKLVPIIAIVLAVLLVVGGGLGIYFYTQHVYQENLAAYEDAQTMLKKGNYDGALEAFQALDNFEDAQDQAQKLEKLQQDYDSALKLLDEGSFDKARSAFKKLDDYRDSENFVKYEVTYREALSYTTAEIPDYKAAAELFDTIADYSDAADQASSCRLTLALALLNEGNYDAALAYQEQLNESDAAQLRSAYGQACDDEAFLLDVEKALTVLLDEEDKLSISEEVASCRQILSGYVDAHFDDPGLSDVLEDMLGALYTMDFAVEENSWPTYYYGWYEMAMACDDLYYDHGGLTSVDMQEDFVGYSDLYYAYYIIESSLTTWWNHVDQLMQDDDGDFITYTNNTGYSFTLKVWLYFYDDSGNLIEENEPILITVEKGKTARIPVEPDTLSYDAWSTCSLDWSIDSVS